MSVSMAIKRRKPGGGNSYHRPKAKRAPIRIDWTKIRRLVLFLLGGVVSVAFFFVLSAAFLVGYRWVTASDWFSLATVDVIGSERLSFADVIRQSGLEPGMNVLGTSVDALERRLSASPWIESVSVKRELPDRFRITLAEKRPAFWIVKEGGLWYADELGVPIDRVAPDKLTLLPQAVFLDDPASRRIKPLELLTRAEELGLPFTLEEAAYIQLSPAHGLELYLDNRDLLVSIAVEDWDRNVTRLTKAWKDLQARDGLKHARVLRAGGANVWAGRSRP